jgi:hypothetical protein
MGQANLFYNKITNRWECRDRGGNKVFDVDGTSLNVVGGITAGGALSAGGGTSITKMGVLTGTLLPITAVGTATTAIGTVSNMTGLAIGDKVFVTPKAAIGGGLVVGNPVIPTTNTLNLTIQHSDPVNAGSLVAVGFDVTYMRT